ncbi:MAG TPA: MFS transporter [Thermoanaerobaculia bacterium]|jgi:EmrB/QacA subfamily drug resistance transporter|nr:MFS transporter [Thermoanaerobaculia bacterium]
MINPKARPCDEGTIRSVRPTADCAASRKKWVLAVTVLASTMAFIDESVVNVALPAIEADLRASVAVIQWLINAYTLSMAALLLIGGAAGDRFGRRRVFLVGAVLFAAASAGCGFSSNVTQLILARAIQGIGAALLIPCSLAILGAAFEEKERGKAIGTWAGASSIAAAIGPLLGGFLVDHGSWRYIFLINPVLALPILWMAWRHVPESRDPDSPAGLDWRGALLAFAGLGSLVYGLIASPTRGWGHPIVIITLCLGALLLAAFIWEEGRSAAPMMPLGLFRSSLFSGVNLLTFLLYGALGGAFFFLPFSLIQVHGYSATRAGAVFLPFTLLMAGLSRWSGGLLDRYGARLPLIVGPAIAALGLALLALPNSNGSYWIAFFLPIVVLGFGMTVTVAPLTTSVINAVPDRQTGVASGINNAVAAVASLLAIAGLGVVALGVFDHSLDRRLEGKALPPEVRQIVTEAHGKFVTDSAKDEPQSADKERGQALVKESLAESLRFSLLVTAALALAGAGCAALMIPKGRRARRAR